MKEMRETEQNRNEANQCGSIRNLGGNVENGQNQCGDAGNHGGSFFFCLSLDFLNIMLEIRLRFS